MQLLHVKKDYSNLAHKTSATANVMYFIELDYSKLGSQSVKLFKTYQDNVATYSRHIRTM